MASSCRVGSATPALEGDNPGGGTTNMQHSDSGETSNETVSCSPPEHLAERPSKPFLTSSVRMKVDIAVAQLEPSADRPFCVVTRASSDCIVLEYAHVLAVDTPSSVLDKLEWVWNMKHKTLNVDTRRNIHPLDATLHQYFHRTDKNQHDGWFWLPDVGDFKLILDMHVHYRGILAAAPSQHAKVRRNPDEFYKDQKVFKYRFVPFPAMQNSWAVRRLTVPRQENGSTAEAEVVQHYYPFDTMPVVSLHIPYHFVICDTGRKLDSVYGADVSKMAADFPQESLMLLAVKNLYDAWMRVEPAWNSEGSFDIAVGEPSSDRPDDGSGHVGSGGPFSHGGNAGSGGRGPPAQDDNRPQSGLGWGMGSVPVRRRAAFQSSLAPGDSGSCFSPDEDDEEGLLEVPQEDDDSDEEWEDLEWGAWLEAWREDVWEATHTRTPSPTNSQESLADVHMTGTVAPLAEVSDSQPTTTPACTDITVQILDGQNTVSIFP
ncbi:hypothetical protein BC628DRAFT_1502097 [Trametes gibbosa]|nr:hypothetical protein BC628DRAFT_1502097 [Trametes gibbosa]